MWTIFYVASISILNLYEMVYGVNHEMKSTPYPTAHEIDRTTKKKQTKQKPTKTMIANDGLRPITTSNPCSRENQGEPLPPTNHLR